MVDRYLAEIVPNIKLKHHKIIQFGSYRIISKANMVVMINHQEINGLHSQKKQLRYMKA